MRLISGIVAEHAVRVCQQGKSHTMYETVAWPDINSALFLHSLIREDEAVKLVSDSELLVYVPRASGELSRQASLMQYLLTVILYTSVPAELERRTAT